MFQYRAKCLPLILLVLLSNASFAQTGSTSNPYAGRENNPYSRYGIGELWDGNNTAIKGMAGTTATYTDPYQINNDNPATYTALQLTTFDIGLIGSSRRIVAADGTSYNTGTASLGYMCFAVPIPKIHSGFSFGFKPYTRDYYALIDTVYTSGMGRTQRSYIGDGGLTYAYLGLAYKIKGLSIGANAGYMFGTFNNNTAVNGIDTSSSNLAYEALFSRYTKVGGIYWKGGITYEHAIDSGKYMLRFGGTYAMSQNLNETMNYYQVSVYNFSDTLVSDTSYRADQAKGKLKLPTSISIGACLSRTDKWSIAVDYTTTNWSQFRSTPDTSMQFGIGKSSYRMAAGGEYSPHSNELHNFFGHIIYRFGVYYGNDYLQIYNTTLPHYGLTFGGSLPFKRSRSCINTSFDIGRLGTNSNGLLQQTYFRFGLGLSFVEREKWGKQRKYD